MYDGWHSPTPDLTMSFSSFRFPLTCLQGRAAIRLCISPAASNWSQPLAWSQHKAKNNAPDCITPTSSGEKSLPASITNPEFTSLSHSSAEQCCQIYTIAQSRWHPFLWWQSGLHAHFLCLDTTTSEKMANKQRWHYVTTDMFYLHLQMISNQGDQ